MKFGGKFADSDLVQGEAGHQVVFLVRSKEYVLHHPQSDVSHKLAGFNSVVLIISFLLLHHCLEDVFTRFILNRKYLKSFIFLSSLPSYPPDGPP